MLKIGVFLVEKNLKFKIYNKVLNKCFKVTRIDYMDEVVYYFDRDKNDEDIVSFDDFLTRKFLIVCYIGLVSGQKVHKFLEV